MKTSETLNDIAGALASAQSQMGGAVRDNDNLFFKSKYADLAEVIKVVKQPFTDNGLSFVQFPYGDADRIGITTRLLHSSGQWMEQTFSMPFEKMDPAKAGAALTYFRRQGLSAVAGVPQVDDDAQILTKSTASSAEVDAIRRRLDATGSDVAKFLKAIGASDLDSMTQEHIRTADIMLKRKESAQ